MTFFTILTLFAELERLLLSPLFAALAISRQHEATISRFFSSAEGNDFLGAAVAGLEISKASRRIEKRGIRNGRQKTSGG
jgi:hypothetical protein